MSNDFDVHLEADAVEAGEHLRGRVRLCADEDKLAKAKALELKAIGRIHGSGTSETVEVLIQRLEGPFAGNVALEFEKRVPEGPVTWEGRYVRWTGCCKSRSTCRSGWCRASAATKSVRPANGPGPGGA